MILRGAATVLSALVLVMLVGCSPGQSAPPSTSRAAASTPVALESQEASDEPAASRGPVDLENLRLALEPFVQVDGGPLAMAAADDGSGRLFIASQDGRIRVVEDGVVLPDPAVDLRPRVRSGGEQGLLGLALHPSFPTDPRVFVNYTDENGDTIVASLALDAADSSRFDPNSHERLLFIDQPFANHNGGAVLFGPDGYLYVFTGDGGGGGDPQGNGQRVDTLLGKVLRVGAEGDVGYVIPPDNPFVATAGMDEIWHLGLRNPWRASFDRPTGDLWLGDVGQSAWEEINVARGGAGGLNFGWNEMEGAHCFHESDCDPEGLTPPVTEYGRELGCTIIGGYVYRGTRFPELTGAYLFADFCDGRILAIDSAATELVPPVEVGIAPGSIAAFGEDVDGELYTLSLDGNVSRLVLAED
jgi:glucose/arabinose dehydrogenase